MIDLQNRLHVYTLYVTLALFELECTCIWVVRTSVLQYPNIVTVMCNLYMSFAKIFSSNGIVIDVSMCH